MKSLLLGAVTIPFVFGLLIYSTGLAIVDVRQGGPDGTRVVVPVPLALADTALLFVKDGKKPLYCPKFAPYQQAALQVAKELRSTGDARFVEVEEASQHVSIDKAGDLFEIRVHDRDEDVFVRVPIAGIEALIASYDGESFTPHGVLAALRKLPHGECVRVRDGDNHVRVWVF